MRNLKIAAAIALLIGSANAMGQGMPVYDNAMNIQTASNQAANIAKYIQQIVELKNQLEQAKLLYSKLNGLRDVGGIMRNELLAQTLPPDYQKAYNSLKNGNNLAGISGSLNAIVKQYATQDCAVNNSGMALKNCQIKQRQNALDQYVGEEGYRQSAKNIANLENFVNSIKSSSDPKSLQDLQARIQTEQVRIQNEQVKLQTIAMMQDAQKKIQEQNQSENTQKMLKPSKPIQF